MRRGDFSSWIANVFGDHPLANSLKQIEVEYRAGNPADAAAGLVQAIRSRYEFIDPEAVQLESRPKLK